MSTNSGLINSNSRRRLVILGVVSIVALNLGFLSWLFFQNRSVSNAEVAALETPATATAVPPTSAPTSPPATAIPDPTPRPASDEAEPTEPAEPTVEPTATATPEPEPTATATPEPEPTARPTATAIPEDAASTYPPLDSLPERGAIYRAPVLTLQGPVQDQATIDAVLERAEQIVGAGNIDNQYVIHPEAPPFEAGNVTVQSAVLFETGSAEIREEFNQILGLGVAVMVTFPQVDMIVEGHTDSDGSDADNQVLSEARANAIVDYITAASGTDPARFDAIGFGETQPVATNSTQIGRALNRRIEVQLLNLLSAGDPSTP